ncbi:hypothetical protein GCM10023331_41210 [Algivirga pacifica]|uniref:Uncharacterized protein n=1 Tax=Algivirga pacifica TaxID=1162670 RepID=A0ABP9DP59_9BACT
MAIDLDGLEASLSFQGFNPFMPLLLSKKMKFPKTVAIDISSAGEIGLGAGASYHHHIGMAYDIKGNIGVYRSDGGFVKVPYYEWDGGPKDGEAMIGGDLTVVDLEGAYLWDIDNVWDYHNTTDIAFDYGIAEGTFATSQIDGQFGGPLEFIESIGGLKYAAGIGGGAGFSHSQTTLISHYVIHQSEVPALVSSWSKAIQNTLQADPPRSFPARFSVFGVDPPSSARVDHYGGRKVSLDFQFEQREDGLYRLFIQGLNNDRVMGDRVNTGLLFNKNDEAGYDEYNSIKSNR